MVKSKRGKTETEKFPLSLNYRYKVGEKSIKTDFVSYIIIINVLTARTTSKKFENVKVFKKNIKG